MGYADTLRSKTSSSLNEDLHLHGGDFNWAVSITYFAVIICIYPSNLLMKRIGGRYWFSVVLAALGTVACTVSAVRSLAGLLAARFFLGVPEASIPASCILYLSFWYKPWLFLIEGLMAVSMALPIGWLLLTYPETSGSLSERERHIAVNRFGRGAPRSTDKVLDTSAFWALVSRPSTWVFTVSYFLQQIVSTSLNNFLPIILNNFNGFSSHKATAYTSIIYFVAIPCYWFWSWHSDHTGERTWHILLPFVAAIPCFAVWTHVAANTSFGNISPMSLYGLAFLGHTVSFANPCLLSYRSSTLYGASEQALGGALALGARRSVACKHRQPTWLWERWKLGHYLVVDSVFKLVDSVFKFYLDSLFKHLVSIFKFYLDSLFKLYLDSFFKHLDSIELYLDSFKLDLDSFKLDLDSFKLDLDSLLKLYLDSLLKHLDSIELYLDSLFQHLESIELYVDSFVKLDLDSLFKLYLDSLFKHVAYV
ncbi:hypothetical protein M409DRAFT_27127 [Zasmidium cellare ATCC 36951]|uniref:Major facilitator superfamily (MFS) profile domain-containing protein n=1 Tax=Zasmidium cellare ATCC 36951 TaxID=1080233 RepID=A0A6A6C6N3_ZASCE|nr:uncharacterized protein M409DRAFT_27127 [Zasmidium cellare ATCC 36951]KAF2162503.1 hypothetical protein M409DRAFT_27127 [Zasmidium cellare ATCC 36951]